jgi:hypothetical protein
MEDFKLPYQTIKENTQIVRYNKNWVPTAEDGTNTFREFNNRFLIEECFRYKTFMKQFQIRFVQHPNVPRDSVRVFTHGFWKPWVFWKRIRVPELGNEKIPKEIFTSEQVLTIEEVEKLYGLIL